MLPAPDLSPQRPSSVSAPRSDAEEQRRGITMRALATGLWHAQGLRGGATQHGRAPDQLARPMTHSLVREAFLHRLVPVLVINKVDWLCTQLRLDASEA